MKDNQNNLYGLLNQQSTRQLDDMLQEELQKEPVDGDAVRVILRVLREREADLPVEVDESTEQAWQKYLRDTSAVQRSTGRRGWILRAAAMAAVLCFVLLIGPLTANAARIYGMLTRWTDSIFEFFDPSDENTNSVEYEFKTDNPGLQQVYDAVVELGVIEPVAPMWLPEGFESFDIKKMDTPRGKGISAHTSDGERHCIIQVNIYGNNSPRSYQKDETYVGTYEIQGRVYSLFRNNTRWVALCANEKLEISISVDCQEDEFYQILNSIYSMEDQ